ncbi:hypothetical protein B9Z19DRAFT_465438 [Tuber borchii]|uniref:Uncharacterized protein n=1 Tax=Tuber borchii TaxID=42251 RepID=A0A2T7A3G5_TUBBO|nr:hypothetical protein B9Z19DRAFT_465438 [Tuber borchii]
MIGENKTTLERFTRADNSLFTTHLIVPFSRKHLNSCPNNCQQLQKKALHQGESVASKTMKISHPVRSAVNKHRIDRLVLQWVTMWESRLLNSFACLYF